ncbi:MAG: transaldolase [Acidimicrobiales bacterium]
MLSQLKVKVFADGADLAGICTLAADPLIKGFTTNPTLMRQAGVSDYERFAREVLEVVTDRPISFEVFSDDHDEMEQQARRIARWAPNVFVKIPVTNTKRVSSERSIRNLVTAGVQLNVTAIFTPAQIDWVASALQDGPASNMSVFAGRIADAGQDPLPIIAHAVAATVGQRQTEVIWASPREVLNVVQANDVGCHIITVTHDLLKKLPGLGKDLDQFSVETVLMFHRDATAAGYAL